MAVRNLVFLLGGKGDPPRRARSAFSICSATTLSSILTLLENETWASLLLPAATKAMKMKKRQKVKLNCISKLKLIKI